MDAHSRTRKARPSLHKPKAADALDRLPPHSPEAEQGVLGCILLDPKACMPRCRMKFRSENVFYEVRHREIWSTLVTLDRQHAGIDIISLQAAMKDRGMLDQVGGLSYLDSLFDRVSSAANLDYYLDIVWEKYQLRCVVKTCGEVVDRVYSFQGDAKELLWATRADFAKALRGSADEDEGCVYRPSELDKFDPKNDANCLLGKRWLCRGGKCMIVGPSGKGKSSLNMQMAVLWALGRDFYGIGPWRPLRSLLIGDENDFGDTAEMFQGSCQGLGLNAFDHAEAFALLERNLEFYNCQDLVGEEFLQAIEAKVMQGGFDLAWLDPLVSFADVDLNKQHEAGRFLRKGLGGISRRSGVVWMVIHHTTKPPKDNGGRRAFGDEQYAGAGSYDLPGWARATMTLRQVEPNLYQLLLPKRGNRSGATHPDGTPTNILWMRHAQDKVFWEQVEPPAEPEPSERKGGKPNTVQRIASMNLFSFCQGCKADGEGKNEIATRLEGWLAKQSEDVSATTCKRIIEALVKNKKLSKSDDGKYRKGENS